METTPKIPKKVANSLKSSVKSSWINSQVSQSGPRSPVGYVALASRPNRSAFSGSSTRTPSLHARLVGSGARRSIVSGRTIAKAEPSHGYDRRSEATAKPTTLNGSMRPSVRTSTCSSILSPSSRASPLSRTISRVPSVASHRPSVMMGSLTAGRSGGMPNTLRSTTCLSVNSVDRPNSTGKGPEDAVTPSMSAMGARKEGSDTPSGLVNVTWAPLVSACLSRYASSTLCAVVKAKVNVAVAAATTTKTRAV